LLPQNWGFLLIIVLKKIQSKSPFIVALVWLRHSLRRDKCGDGEKKTLLIKVAKYVEKTSDNRNLRKILVL
jgi:hypothetical protein